MKKISIGEWADDSGAQAANGRAIATMLTRWLPLAATPTFALMAVLTAILGNDVQSVICLGNSAGSLTHNMGIMYLLMSVFHVTPWIRWATDYRR